MKFENITSPNINNYGDNKLNILLCISSFFNTTSARNFFYQIFSYRNPRTLAIESFALDSGRTFVLAEYGYPKGSPNTNS
jgi:hypothetical protein